MNFMKCVLVISAHFSTQLKTKCNNVEKCSHLCLFNLTFSFFQEKSKSFKNSLFIDIYIYSCVLHVMVDAKICIYLIIYSKIMHIGTWWRNGNGAKTKMQHA